VKLPLREAEKDALLRELVEWEGFVSSSLLGVESLRACARYGASYERAAREWMEGLALVPIDERGSLRPTIHCDLGAYDGAYDGERIFDNGFE